MAGGGGGGGGLSPLGPAPPMWYHRDLSRAAAEELLARAGRDGSFLVRDSESVNGAYALCVLFQKHVHTYRILPDEEGFLAVQTSQGVQPKRFKTLPELVSLYLQPSQGLVTTLLYAVDREETAIPDDRDYSDGEDEKPPLPPRSASTSTPPVSDIPSDSAPTANGLSTISHEYLKGSYALDLEAVKQGACSLPHLNKTLVASCKRLNGEVDKVLSGLEILSKVFDQQSAFMVSKMIQQSVNQGGDQELENLVTKLAILKDLLSSIEKKALKALQDMSLSTLCSPPPLSMRHSKTIPVQPFEVKLDVYLAELTKIGKSQKYTLSVDVEGGRLVVMKKVKDSQEDWTTFTHDKIRQLIKSQRVQNKLGIVFEKEKDKSQRKDFIFASAKKREAFCQLLQLMKNKHSNQDEPDMISVFIGTWNMGSVPAPKSVASWVLCRGLGKTLEEMTVTIPHDLYAFGTQENSVCDREWVESLRAMLKEQTELDYKPIAVQTLWNIKVAVLVKPEHENRISHVGMSSVKTGIANTLGNKGAVGVSFMFNGTSFGFVNCHLTSGNEKIARRNQNYLDILRLLSLGDKQLSSFDISLRFTHLFWLGDLNYRLDMDIQEILNYINRKEFDPLLKVDQLNLEREKNKVFLRFAEEEISFPPTYRYERGSRDTYVWQKQKATGMRTNVPSWCDRILWKSYPETHIVCNSYGCTDDIVTSDHSPVFGTFEVGVTSQFVSKKGLPKSSEQAYIEFESIEAIVKTASRTKFFIEFYSTCLEEFKKSYENDSQSSDNVNFLRLGWSSKQLTTLKPLLSEIEYLQDQHLLLTVKSLDGYESYGECVLALKSMIGSTAQQFHTYLSHRGEETGNIRGSMRVRVPAERMGTRERLYEWISVDKDETGVPKGKSLSSRAGHEYVKPPMVRKQLGELGKVSEEGEKSSKEEIAARPKQDSSDGDQSVGKNSYNNPAYYILEGVPNQSAAALSSELLPSPTSTTPQATKAPPPISVARTKPPCAPTGSSHPRRPMTGHTVRAISEEGSIEDDGGACVAGPQGVATVGSTLNRPPPDFPPPPLPKGAMEMAMEASFLMPRSLHPDLAEVKIPAAGSGAPLALGESFRRGGCAVASGPIGGGALDDQSCSVLQMAKTLSETEFPGQPPRAPSAPPPLRGQAMGLSLDPCRTFPPRNAIAESIAEDLPEEALWGSSSSSLSVGDSSVGEWLQRLGLERYEQGLLHNGWDDLEFLSDITEEDLEEAGVLDPAHKCILLESLRQQQKL
ncbi:phosphatidylinositol 3,4,5-trisphosphate 5-phosphatase 2A [Corythoichthys intestinalis]|uniref:phosphatidylinositol 3,4,5-trisphosphate 5-phosphatase 2A n=1 Tax=Corythoichthys intestinalis TaxID=161448 RepID=UPI0025A5426F|nr:phosphatidylinositol 3,4,5-trisphosphate 5-phosphatase 2A [Corythoichthys intestinalis]XP_057694864.1 phosphatidylinositol 3,4,5-trisphosphate 5-phosphatase 2A [Corythoichthys intestinalis]XP_061797228.1 phosphatidylinositol 3,4,5-trisphosphate 5-phosphatase 2A-like [Nerophis lumbriciformis]